MTMNLRNAQETLVLGEGEDSRTYRILKMNPMKGGRFALKVAKTIAPALSTDDDILGSLSNFKEEDGASIILKVLAGAVSNVDADAVYELGMEALKHECFAGQRKLSDESHFNSHFSEHPGDLLKVMVFAVRVNCKGFLDIRGLV